MGALRVGISLTDTDSAADELLLRRYLSSGNGVGHWRMGNASQYPAALIAAIWGYADIEIASHITEVPDRRLTE